MRRRRAAAGGLRVWRLIAALALLAGACGGGDDRAEPAAGTTDTVESAGEAEEEPQVDSQVFVTRPDLTPPVVDVVVDRVDEPALYFLAPKQAGAQKGALIIDGDGEVVWSQPNDLTVADFRVQAYRGEPVLTWYEGRSLGGYGDGEFVIADTSYTEVTRVEAGNGLAGDLHEFQLTGAGTALVLAYELEPADLSAVGGPADAYHLDNLVQEVDVETGRVLFEWSAHDHVPIEDTFSELVPDAAATEDERDEDGTKEAPFDWFHVNSVAEGPDGTLLVSARNTHAVYAVDRTTGEIRWTLGGRSSDFEMAEGATFAWQHDARLLPDGTLSLFDNQANPPLADRSRGLVLALDEQAGTATVVREWTHPDDVLAGSQGNTQVLDGGGAVVGWGSEGRVTEYGADGAIVFDATWHPADSYRVFRLPWTGRPTAPPDVVARPAGDRVGVFASWNGATDVAAWRVLGGDDAADLDVRETVPRAGFETAVTVDGARFVAVEALAASGEVLGTSAPVPVEG
ncbi:MAG TPA: arylsulfotransferase family protein [Acidimicrobiales bacterium]